jgi:hypothetical protein
VVVLKVIPVSLGNHRRRRSLRVCTKHCPEPRTPINTNMISRFIHSSEKSVTSPKNTSFKQIIKPENVKGRDFFLFAGLEIVK